MIRKVRKDALQLTGYSELHNYLRKTIEAYLRLSKKSCVVVKYEVDPARSPQQDRCLHWRIPAACVTLFVAIRHVRD